MYVRGNMTDKNEPLNPPLSFLNTEFLKSPPARIIRIIAEYLEPAERLRRAQVRDTIVFFGSARSVPRLARYYEDAAELSRRLTEWSKSLTGNRDFIVCSMVLRNWRMKPSFRTICRNWYRSGTL